jgi:UDP-2-acetamido-3-amino-2,3-dideoxy-glucuronate N-acetyltransferase
MSEPSSSPSSQIDPRAVVEAGVQMGAGCKVGPGAFVGAGTVLGVGVEVGPLAVLGAMAGADVAPLRVAGGVRIGAHATVQAGLELAAHCVVMPGAVVSRSVPPGAMVEGNPASIVGYVGTGATLSAPSPVQARGRVRVEYTSVKGVQIHHFPIIPDLRGSLTVGEFERQIPFLPQRYFVVFDVPSREVRGEHAHRRCQELLICLRGSCAVVVDDGQRRAEIVLDSPNMGVLLPAMVWRVHYKYSPDAMSLVFASTYYDPADYIRDYEQFLHESQRPSEGAT